MSPRTFVTRGLALMALASLGLAACSDNTTVIPPEPVAVTVVPPALTLGVGQSGQFVAAVTGGPTGGSTAVTWSSSNSALVSVDATGKVTVARAPTATEGTSVTITATSQQDPNAKGAGVVNITVTAPPPPPPPATITIADITAPGGGTVDPTNISGSINIILNVDVPQGAQVSRVDVKLDAATVCSQSFTSGTQGQVSTNEADVVQVICPINTAATKDSLGTPSFLNGPHTLTAALVAPSGTTAASVTQTLVFNNANRVIPTITTSGASAVGPLGLTWRQGDLVVKAVPTLFTGGTLSRVTVSVTPANGGGTAVQVDSTASDGFTVTFPQNKSLASNGVGGVQDSVNIVVTTVTSTGQGGPSNSFGVNQPQTLRLDNVAPSVTAITLPPPSPAAGNPIFLNGTFAFAASAVTATDAGVNNVTFTFFAGPDTAHLTQVTTGSQLAEVAVPTYILRVVAKDALGNDTIVYAAAGNTVSTTVGGAVKFAVDVTPPVATITGTPNLATVTVLNSASWAVTAQDTGAAPSGIGTNSISGRQFVITPTGTTCATGVVSGVCQFVSPGTGAAGTINATPSVGYDSVTIRVTDVAGNVNTVATRLILQDNAAPSMGGIVGPATITGGSSATFSTAASDNIDLGLLTPTLSYGAALDLGFAPTTIGTFGTDAFTTSATPSVAISPFIAGIQFTVAGGAPTGASQGATLVTFN
ncbi:MAG TPA: Ig-like domain-containing protein, partial [Longimicrobiales bacterium]|nr:Ig-like domain-containing protein [Longimicrobiales bacterium]